MIVDAVLFAALPDEHAAMRQMLAGLSPLRTTRHQGEFDQYDIVTLNAGVRVVLAPPTAMGHLNAATATACLLHDLKPRVAILGGIAGCLASKDTGKYALGDVAVSEQIVDYELEKIRDNGRESRARGYNTNADLGRAIRARLSEWPRENEDLPLRPNKDDGRPRVHTVNFLSGNQVVASEQLKQELLSNWPTSIAIEMESAGIAAMLRGMRLADRFLMVKAFTDWADGTKNDDWREYACRTAASYIGFLLTDVIPRWLASIRASQEDEELFKRRVQHASRCFLEARAEDIPFVRGMAEAVLDQAIAEAHTLATMPGSSDEPYQTQVGTGHQFLLRAGPLFRSARRIFATSLDSVSTFWMDTRNSLTAKDYINTHRADHDGGSVMRLFVFSTPERAHSHARVLDYHADRFENTFIASRDAYQRLVEERIAPNSAEKYMTKDFAVLECPIVVGQQLFFADLDYDTFTLRRANTGGRTGEVDCDATIALFEELSAIPLGTFNETHRVLKWDRKHWARKEEWAAHLTAMFGEPTADAFHLVSFNVSEQEYQELRSVLAGIKYQIFEGNGRQRGTLAERHGIRDVWLAKQLSRRNGIQSDFGGQIHYPDDPAMQYILLMRFADSERLTGFMRERENLDMRLRIFGRFTGVVKDVMTAFKITESPDFEQHADRARVLHDILERLAADRMRRYDYREDELISEIVRVAPPVF